MKTQDNVDRDIELEERIADLTDHIERRYYGKHRGIVMDNDDPLQLGRLRVSAPGLLGPDVTLDWALPCTPYGGADNQGWFFVPEKGAGVWIEFEDGLLDWPIWVGCYWTRPKDKSETPRGVRANLKDESKPAPAPGLKLLRTAQGHLFQFDDRDGTESLTLCDGKNKHVLRMDKEGLKLLAFADENGAGKQTLSFRTNAIEIQDANQNALKLSDSAFEITAKKPFTINAAGQPVTIKGATVDFVKA